MSTMFEFRAGEEPDAPRRDYWERMIGAAMGAVNVPLGGDGTISGSDETAVGQLGAVRVGMVSAYRAGTAVRTAKHIRQSDPDFCKIDFLAAGRAVVEQDGREAALRPGDFTVVDLSRPATWAVSPMRMIFVTFPRALLPLRPDELAQLTAVTIPGNHGAGALVSTLARQLPDHLGDTGVTTRIRLGTAVLDLLTAGMSARLDLATAVPPETRQRALPVRIQTFIEERLGDPQLSPGSIAAAHHISLRYLHKLFQEQNTTVAGWIRERRLEHCRRDLLDPTQHGRPVSAIAARWGIPNAAHFNRAFRAEYGIAPGEYRRAYGCP